MDASPSIWLWEGSEWVYLQRGYGPDTRRSERYVSGTSMIFCALYLLKIAANSEAPRQASLTFFRVTFCLHVSTAYWGRIIDINDPSDGGASTTEANSIPTTTDSKNHDEPKTVEINGSVLDGWGLEPLPVARFTMIEETQEYDDDDDDDEDEADLFRQSLENYADFSVGNDGGSRNENSDNDIDPFPSLDDAFQ